MAVIFLCQETAQAAGGAVEAARRPAGFAAGASFPSAILEAAAANPALLPSAVDAVRAERFVPGTNGRLVVLLRDAHANLSAQKNIHKAAEFWAREAGIDLILSEAAWGEAGLADARGALPASDLKRASDRLLWENLITGHEYLTLVSDLPVRIVGIEDPRLYRRNWEVFRRMMSGREPIDTALARSRAAVDGMKQRDYPKELLDHESAAGKGGDWTGRYRAIRALAEGSGVRLDADAEAALEPFRAAEAMEGEIDRARLAQEQELALGEARVRCGSCADELLEAFEKAGPSVAALHSAVGRLARASGLDNRGSAAELVRYQRYLESVEALDPAVLDAALESLEEDLYAGLAGSRDARVTRFVDRHTRLLTSAYALRLTPEETRRLNTELLRVRPASWQAELNDRLIAQGRAEDILEYGSELAPRLTAVRNFYRLAALRDKVFVRRSHEVIADSGESAAIVVSGGYHTDRLTELFVKRGYSVAVFTPYVTDQTDQAAYERTVLASDPGSPAAIGPDAEGSARSALLAPLVRTPAGAARLASAIPGLSGDPGTLAKKLVEISSVLTTAPAMSGARMAETPSRQNLPISERYILNSLGETMREVIRRQEQEFSTHPRYKRSEDIVVDPILWKFVPHLNGVSEQQWLSTLTLAELGEEIRSRILSRSMSHWNEPSLDLRGRDFLNFFIEMLTRQPNTMYHHLHHARLYDQWTEAGDPIMRLIRPEIRAAGESYKALFREIAIRWSSPEEQAAESATARMADGRPVTQPSEAVPGISWANLIGLGAIFASAWSALIAVKYLTGSWWISLVLLGSPVGLIHLFYGMAAVLVKVMDLSGLRVDPQLALVRAQRIKERIWEKAQNRRDPVLLLALESTGIRIVGNDVGSARGVFFGGKDGSDVLLPAALVWDLPLLRQWTAYLIVRRALGYLYDQDAAAAMDRENYTGDRRSFSYPFWSIYSAHQTLSRSGYYPAVSVLYILSHSLLDNWFFTLAMVMSPEILTKPALRRTATAILKQAYEPAQTTVPSPEDTETVLKVLSGARLSSDSEPGPAGSAIRFVLAAIAGLAVSAAVFASLDAAAALTVVDVRDPLAYVLMSATAFISWGSAAWLHEIGHAAAGWLFGAEVRLRRYGNFMIVARLTKYDTRQRIAFLAGGPAANLIAAAVIWIILFLGPEAVPEVHHFTLYATGVLNGAFGLGALVPVRPDAGGGLIWRLMRQGARLSDEDGRSPRSEGARMAVRKKHKNRKLGHPKTTAVPSARSVTTLLVGEGQEIVYTDFAGAKSSIELTIEDDPQRTSGALLTLRSNDLSGHDLRAVHVLRSNGKHRRHSRGHMKIIERQDPVLGTRSQTQIRYTVYPSDFIEFSASLTGKGPFRLRYKKVKALMGRPHHEFKQIDRSSDATVSMAGSGSGARMAGLPDEALTEDTPVRDFVEATGLWERGRVMRTFTESSSGFKVYEVETEVDFESEMPEGTGILRELFDFKWKGLGVRRMRFYVLFDERRMPVAIYPKEGQVPESIWREDLKNHPSDHRLYYERIDLSPYTLPSHVLRDTGAGLSRTAVEAEFDRISRLRERVKKFDDHYRTLDQAIPGRPLSESILANVGVGGVVPYVYLEWDTRHHRLWAISFNENALEDPDSGLRAFHRAQYTPDEKMDKNRFFERLFSSPERPRAVWVQYPWVYPFQRNLGVDKAFRREVYETLRLEAATRLKNGDAVADLGTGTGVSLWVAWLAGTSSGLNLRYFASDLNPMAAANARFNFRLNGMRVDTSVADVMLGRDGRTAFAVPIQFLMANAPASSGPAEVSDGVQEDRGPADNVSTLAHYDGGDPARRFWHRLIDQIGDPRFMDVKRGTAVIWNKARSSLFAQFRSLRAVASAEWIPADGTRDEVMGYATYQVRLGPKLGRLGERLEIARADLGAAYGLMLRAVQNLPERERNLYLRLAFPFYLTLPTIGVAKYLPMAALAASGQWWATLIVYYAGPIVRLALMLYYRVRHRLPMGRAITFSLVPQAGTFLALPAQVLDRESLSRARTVGRLASDLRKAAAQSAAPSRVRRTTLAFSLKLADAVADWMEADGGVRQWTVLGPGISHRKVERELARRRKVLLVGYQGSQLAQEFADEMRLPGSTEETDGAGIHHLDLGLAASALVSDETPQADLWIKPISFLSDGARMADLSGQRVKDLRKEIRAEVGITLSTEHLRRLAGLDPQDRSPGTVIRIVDSQAVSPEQAGKILEVLYTVKKPAVSQARPLSRRTMLQMTAAFGAVGLIFGAVRLMRGRSGHAPELLEVPVRPTPEGIISAFEFLADWMRTHDEPSAAQVRAYLSLLKNSLNMRLSVQARIVTMGKFYGENGIEILLNPTGMDRLIGTAKRSGHSSAVIEWVCSLIAREAMGTDFMLRYRDSGVKMMEVQQAILHGLSNVPLSDPDQELEGRAGLLRSLVIEGRTAEDWILHHAAFRIVGEVHEDLAQRDFLVRQEKAGRYSPADLDAVSPGEPGDRELFGSKHRVIRDEIFPDRPLLDRIAEQLALAIIRDVQAMNTGSAREATINQYAYLIAASRKGAPRIDFDRLEAAGLLEPGRFRELAPYLKEAAAELLPRVQKLLGEGPGASGARMADAGRSSAEGGWVLRRIDARPLTSQGVFGEEPIHGPVVILSDNSGTLAQDFRAPMTPEIGAAIERFLSVSDRYFVIQSGDPESGLLKQYAPLISILARTNPAALTERFFIVCDGGTTRIHFERDGRAVIERDERWAVDYRRRLAEAYLSAFYEEWEAGSGIFSWIKGPASDTLAARARSEALARLEKAWDIDVAGHIITVPLIPEGAEYDAVRALIGGAEVYDVGSKVTLTLHADKLKESAEKNALMKRVYEKVLALRPWGPDETDQPYLIHGPGYVDAARRSKGSGIRVLFDSRPSLRALKERPAGLPDQYVTKIVVGDSGNDYPAMMDEALIPGSRNLNVFVNRLPEYAEELPGTAVVSLRDHVEGTIDLLHWLERAAPAVPNEEILEPFPAEKWLYTPGLPKPGPAMDARAERLLNLSLSNRAPFQIAEWFSGCIDDLRHRLGIDTYDTLLIVTRRIQEALIKHEIEPGDLHRSLIWDGELYVYVPRTQVEYQDLRASHKFHEIFDAPAEKILARHLELTRPTSLKEPGVPDIVIIAGAAGSGKTTFAGKLENELIGNGVPAVRISVDDFLLPREIRRAEGLRGVEAFDRERLSRVMSVIRSGGVTALPKYAPKDGSITETEPVDFSQYRTVILEGAFPMAFEPIRVYADFRVFIHENAQTQYDSRLARDPMERGYQPVDIAYSFAEVGVKETLSLSYRDIPVFDWILHEPRGEQALPGSGRVQPYRILWRSDLHDPTPAARSLEGPGARMAADDRGAGASELSRKLFKVILWSGVVTAAAAAIHYAVPEFLGMPSPWERLMELQRNPGWESAAAAAVISVAFGFWARISGMYLSDTFTRRSPRVIMAMFAAQLFWRPVHGVYSDQVNWFIADHVPSGFVQPLVSLVLGLFLSAVFDLLEPMLLSRVDTIGETGSSDPAVRERALQTRSQTGLKSQSGRVLDGILSRGASSYFQHAVAQLMFDREYRLLVVSAIGLLNNTYRTWVAYSRDPRPTPTGVLSVGLGIAAVSFAIFTPSVGITALVIAVAGAAYFKRMRPDPKPPLIADSARSKLEGFLTVIRDPDEAWHVRWANLEAAAALLEANADLAVTRDELQAVLDVFLADTFLVRDEAVKVVRALAVNDPSLLDAETALQFLSAVRSKDRAWEEPTLQVLELIFKAWIRSAAAKGSGFEGLLDEGTLRGMAEAAVYVLDRQDPRSTRQFIQALQNFLQRNFISMCRESLGVRPDLARPGLNVAAIQAARAFAGLPEDGIPDDDESSAGARMAEGGATLKPRKPALNQVLLDAQLLSDQMQADLFGSIYPAHEYVRSIKQTHTVIAGLFVGMVAALFRIEYLNDPIKLIPFYFWFGGRLMSHASIISSTIRLSREPGLQGRIEAAIGAKITGLEQDPAAKTGPQRSLRRSIERLKKLKLQMSFEHAKPVAVAYALDGRIWVYFKEPYLRRWLVWLYPSPSWIQPLEDWKPLLSRLRDSWRVSSKRPRALVGRPTPAYSALPTGDLAGSSAARMADLRLAKIAEDLVRHYESTDRVKARDLAARIRSGQIVPAAAESRIRATIESDGRKLGEVLPQGSVRYMDLNGRWILTVDPNGNMVDQLIWAGSGRFVSARTRNTNSSFVILDGDPSTGLVQWVEVSDPQRGRQAPVLLLEPSLDLDRAGSIPRAEFQDSDSINIYDARGSATSVLRVIAHLAQDQGKPLAYTGNSSSVFGGIEPTARLYKSLAQVARMSVADEPPALAPHLKHQRRLEIFLRDPLSQSWSPDPPERIFLDDERSALSFRGGRLERVTLNGREYLNIDLPWDEMGYGLHYGTLRPLDGGVYQLEDRDGDKIFIDESGRIVPGKAERSELMIDGADGAAGSEGARMADGASDPASSALVLGGVSPSGALLAEHGSAALQTMLDQLIRYYEFEYHNKFSKVSPAALEPAVLLLARRFPDTAVAEIIRRKKNMTGRLQPETPESIVITKLTALPEVAEFIARQHPELFDWFVEQAVVNPAYCQTVGSLAAHHPDQTDHHWRRILTEVERGQTSIVDAQFVFTQLAPHLSAGTVSDTFRRWVTVIAGQFYSGDVQGVMRAWTEARGGTEPVMSREMAAREYEGLAKEVMWIHGSADDNSQPVRMRILAGVAGRLDPVRAGTALDAVLRTIEDDGSRPLNALQLELWGGLVSSLARSAPGAAEQEWERLAASSDEEMTSYQYYRTAVLLSGLSEGLRGDLAMGSARKIFETWLYPTDPARKDRDRKRERESWYHVEHGHEALLNAVMDLLGRAGPATDPLLLAALTGAQMEERQEALRAKLRGILTDRVLLDPSSAGEALRLMMAQIFSPAPGAFHQARMDLARQAMDEAIQHRLDNERKGIYHNSNPRELDLEYYVKDETSSAIRALEPVMIGAPAEVTGDFVERARIYEKDYPRLLRSLTLQPVLHRLARLNGRPVVPADPAQSSDRSRDLIWYVRHPGHGLILYAVPADADLKKTYQSDATTWIGVFDNSITIHLAPVLDPEAAEAVWRTLFAEISEAVRDPRLEGASFLFEMPGWMRVIERTLRAQAEGEADRKLLADNLKTQQNQVKRTAVVRDGKLEWVEYELGEGGKSSGSLDSGARMAEDAKFRKLFQGDAQPVVELVVGHQDPGAVVTGFEKRNWYVFDAKRHPRLYRYTYRLQLRVRGSDGTEREGYVFVKYSGDENGAPITPSHPYFESTREDLAKELDYSRQAHRAGVFPPVVRVGDALVTLMSGYEDINARFNELRGLMPMEQRKIEFIKLARETGKALGTLHSIRRPAEDGSSAESYLVHLDLNWIGDGPSPLKDHIRVRPDGSVEFIDLGMSEFRDDSTRSIEYRLIGQIVTGVMSEPIRAEALASYEAAYEKALSGARMASRPHSAGRSVDRLDWTGRVRPLRSTKDHRIYDAAELIKHADPDALLRAMAWVDYVNEQTDRPEREKQLRLEVREADLSRRIASYRTKLEMAVSGGTRILIAVTRQRRVAGWAEWWAAASPSKPAELDRIDVLPAQRRLGVGMLLLGQVISEAQARGEATLYFDVIERSAKEFYEKYLKGKFKYSITNDRFRVELTSTSRTVPISGVGVIPAGKVLPTRSFSAFIQALDSDPGLVQVPEYLDAVREAMVHDSWSRRKNALRAVARYFKYRSPLIRSDDFDRVLGMLAEDPDPDVRTDALGALTAAIKADASWATPAVLKRLIGNFKSSNFEAYELFHDLIRTILDINPALFTPENMDAAAELIKDGGLNQKVEGLKIILAFLDADDSYAQREDVFRMAVTSAEDSLSEDGTSSELTHAAIEVIRAFIEIDPDLADAPSAAAVFKGLGSANVLACHSALTTVPVLLSADTSCATVPNLRVVLSASDRVPGRQSEVDRAIEAFLKSWLESGGSGGKEIWMLLNPEARRMLVDVTIRLRKLKDDGAETHLLTQLQVFLKVHLYQLHRRIKDAQVKNSKVQSTAVSSAVLGWVQSVAARMTAERSHSGARMALNAADRMRSALGTEHAKRLMRLLGLHPENDRLIAWDEAGEEIKEYRSAQEFPDARRMVTRHTARIQGRDGAERKVVYYFKRWDAPGPDLWMLRRKVVKSFKRQEAAARTIHEAGLGPDAALIGEGLAMLEDSGRSLADRVAEHETPMTERVRVAASVGGALGRLHGQRRKDLWGRTRYLVHNDLVMIDDDGQDPSAVLNDHIRIETGSFRAAFIDPGLAAYEDDAGRLSEKHLLQKTLSRWAPDAPSSMMIYDTFETAYRMAFEDESSSKVGGSRRAAFSSFIKRWIGYVGWGGIAAYTVAALIRFDLALYWDYIWTTAVYGWALTLTVMSVSLFKPGRTLLALSAALIAGAMIFLRADVLETRVAQSLAASTIAVMAAILVSKLLYNDAAPGSYNAGPDADRERLRRAAVSAVWWSAAATPLARLYIGLFWNPFIQKSGMHDAWDKTIFDLGFASTVVHVPLAFMINLVYGELKSVGTDLLGGSWKNIFRSTPIQTLKGIYRSAPSQTLRRFYPVNSLFWMAALPMVYGWSGDDQTRLIIASSIATAIFVFLIEKPLRSWYAGTPKPDVPKSDVPASGARMAGQVEAWVARWKGMVDRRMEEEVRRPAWKRVVGRWTGSDPIEAAVRAAAAQAAAEGPEFTAEVMRQLSVPAEASGASMISVSASEEFVRRLRERLGAFASSRRDFMRMMTAALSMSPADAAQMLNRVSVNVGFAPWVHIRTEEGWSQLAQTMRRHYGHLTAVHSRSPQQLADDWNRYGPTQVLRRWDTDHQLVESRGRPAALAKNDLAKIYGNESLGRLSLAADERVARLYRRMKRVDPPVWAASFPSYEFSLLYDQDPRQVGEADLSSFVDHGIGQVSQYLDEPVYDDGLDEADEADGDLDLDVDQGPSFGPPAVLYPRILTEWQPAGPTDSGGAVLRQPEDRLNAFIRVGLRGERISEGGALFCNLIVLADPGSGHIATVHTDNDRSPRLAELALQTALRLMGSSPDKVHATHLRPEPQGGGLDEMSRSVFRMQEAALRTIGIHVIGSEANTAWHRSDLEVDAVPMTVRSAATGRTLKLVPAAPVVRVRKAGGAGPEGLLPRPAAAIETAIVDGARFAELARTRIPDRFAVSLPSIQGARLAVVAHAQRDVSGRTVGLDFYPERGAAAVSPVAHMVFREAFERSTTVLPPPSGPSAGNGSDVQRRNRILKKLAPVLRDGGNRYAIHELSSYARPLGAVSADDIYDQFIRTLLAAVKDRTNWKVRFTYRGVPITVDDIPSEWTADDGARILRARIVLGQYHFASPFPKDAVVVGDHTLVEAKRLASEGAASGSAGSHREWTGTVISSGEGFRTPAAVLMLQMALSTRERIGPDSIELEYLRWMTGNESLTADEADWLRTGDLDAIGRSGWGRFTLRALGARLAKALERAALSILQTAVSA